MTNPTNAELEQIIEAAGKATPGPWYILGCHIRAEHPNDEAEGPYYIVDRDMDARIDYDTTGAANAQLITLACNHAASMARELKEMRARVAPVADEAVGEIRARHEADLAAYAHDKLAPPPRYVRDMQTVLIALTEAQERAERAEADKAVIDEALTMACDERDEAYAQFDKLKEAAAPFTWYLSSSVFDDRPDDYAPQTTEDVGRRVPRLGDYRRLRRAALTQEPAKDNSHD